MMPLSLRAFKIIGFTVSLLLVAFLNAWGR